MGQWPIGTGIAGCLEITQLHTARFSDSDAGREIKDILHIQLSSWIIFPVCFYFVLNASV